MYSNHDAVKVLLRHKANANLPTMHGHKNALELAAALEEAECSSVLLFARNNNHVRRPGSMILEEATPRIVMYPARRPTVTRTVCMLLL